MQCFLLLPQDVAVLQLAVPIGLKTGWVGGKAILCGERFGVAGPPVNLLAAGFPLFAPGNMEKRPSRCYISQCRASAVCEASLAMMSHDCDLTKGQSGAPMLDDQMNVRAVHVQGVSAWSGSSNLATPLTKYIIDQVSLWT
jgi:hypothetical protein